MNPQAMSEEDEHLLEARLPWYVNGTLDDEARAWVDEQLARRPALQQRLQREWALQKSVGAAAQWPAPDIGLDRLMTRLQSEGEWGSGSRKRLAGLPSWAQWLRMIGTPPVAGALAASVLAQAGVIAWLASHPDVDAGQAGLRSIGVTEMRTLRVSFKPEASETQIRAALVAAGARIVGGPTQLGEYWVASGSSSLEELRTVLLNSRVTASIDIDTAGPRGR